MNRIGIATFVATIATVCSAVGCQNGHHRREGETGAWFEVRPPSNPPAHGEGMRDIVIDNVKGNVDSIVASPLAERKILLYNAYDSVSTSGTPHLLLKVGPGPKQ